MRNATVNLPRQTLARWVELAADWLTPIYKQIRTGVLAGGYVQIDETPVEYLEPGYGKTKQGYLWTVCRPRQDVFFWWNTSRAAACLDQIVPADFKGTVQCDGYAAYPCFAETRDGAIILAGCWAHVRRGFYEAREQSPKVNGWFLRQIQNLYRIESVLRDKKAGPSISYGVMGNPDLNPEFTVQYEFGFKQAISNILGFQLSFFYKDINELLGTEVIETYNSAEYWRFTNVDFGSVYGFTLSLFQQNFSNISSSLNYTLQFAEGNSSDPRETTNRAAAGQDPRPKYVPFNWDQRHTLNLTAIYSLPDNFAVSTILKFGTGQPYTPVIGTGFGADQDPNSGNKASYFLIDLRGEKYFNLDVVNLRRIPCVARRLDTVGETVNAPQTSSLLCRRRPTCSGSFPFGSG